MKVRVLLARFAPAVVVVAMLAGCAAPAAAPSTSPRRSSAPTPSPTPSAAAAPGSRVPLGCAKLLPAAAVQSIAGASATVGHDENTPPTNMVQIAQLQFGALSCEWDPTRSVGATLQIDVAPDSKSEFEGNFAAIMADQSIVSHPSATMNVAGDQSGYWCISDIQSLGADGTPTCDAEMLVGNYWVGVRVLGVQGLSATQVDAGLGTVLTDTAANLTAAGPVPKRWAAPATTPPGFCTDASSTAQVRTVLGDRTLAAIAYDTRAVYASTVGSVGPDASCGWSSAAYGSVYVDLLAGGSWAFPAISPVAPADATYAGNPYSALSIPGATSAMVSCGDGTCDAYLAIGTAAADIILRDPGAAKRVAVLAGFAKDIAAS